MKALLTTHKKFLVALIGVVVIGLNNYAGMVIPWEPIQIFDIIIALAAALGVEAASNA